MDAVIYYGGPILTLEPGPDPEAVLVREGRIEAVGPLEKCLSLAPRARRFCLDGRALLPAFLDPHSHVTSLASTCLLYTSHSPCVSPGRRTPELISRVPAPWACR